MSALERYAAALASGRTNRAGQDALDAGRELTELGRYLLALRDAGCGECFAPALKAWERTSRRVVFRAGYRVGGNTQRRLAKDSLKAWSFALCPRCQGKRTDCSWCAQTGSVLPGEWMEGESLELFRVAITALDQRYSDACRALYRAARAEELSTGPAGP